MGRVPGRGNSQCKVPEAGACLVYLMNCEEVGVCSRVSEGVSGGEKFIDSRGPNYI